MHVGYLLTLITLLGENFTLPLDYDYFRMIRAVKIGKIQQHARRILKLGIA